MKRKAMIYLDANIFLYPQTGTDTLSGACVVLLEKAVKEEIEAGTSVLTWDEFHHSLHKKLGKSAATEQSKLFLALPGITFFPATEEVITKAQEIVEKYRLDPRDAIHAATALLNNCTAIVSDDPDFDAVKELKRTPLKH